MELTYEELIKRKITRAMPDGFDISENEMNPILFPVQKFVLKRALKQGRFAILADCGNGKTYMQLEWGKLMHLHTGGLYLFFAPLAVVEQTIEQGLDLGIQVSKLNLKNLPTDGLHIINYDQIKNIPQEFIDSNIKGVVLDESSCLKNYTGEIKRMLIDKFQSTPYKLCCTATIAPNDLNEVGNHSEFLKILDAQDMRARWFVRDEGMNNYRLKKHAERDFYGWISSWAIMYSNPAEIGFPMESFNLPELIIHDEIVVNAAQRENGKLFNDSAVNATTFNTELSLTTIPRMEEAAKIVNASDEPWIIWVNHNDEAATLLKLIPDAVEVSGSEKPDVKSKKLLGFAHGDFRVLVTKKKIAQFGLNYQHCPNQIFAALDFSFEGFYQAVRRSWRFGAKKTVNIYLITTDTMENVKASIDRRRIEFEKMKREMNKWINEVDASLKIDYSGEVFESPDYKFVNGDSVELIKEIPNNSIDFSVFSPPFKSLFTYSDNLRDMGNCATDDEFFQQYRFLLQDLHRVIKPGRLVAVHTKDLPVYKNSSGYSGLDNFTGDNHRAFEEVGFKYHSKICIWTDPVLEMQRTKTQRLLYSQLRRDSAATGVGLPEYVTIFRKWEGFEGFKHKKINNKTKENFDLLTWQKWASPIWGEKLKPDEIAVIQDYLSELLAKPVEEIDLSQLKADWCSNSWFDIKRTDVLNGKEGTDQGDEKHIAPLQLSVIERCIAMWSNPHETVFSPFGGIASEGYKAVQMHRKFIGFELKPSYWRTGCNNLKKAAHNKNLITLF
jgi:DNA modification methylase